MKVTDTDDDDDENLGTLIVALMQKNRRKMRKEGLDMLTIGYVIYKVCADALCQLVLVVHADIMLLSLENTNLDVHVVCIDYGVYTPRH